MIGHVIPEPLFKQTDLDTAKKLQEWIDWYVLEHGHEPLADAIIATLDRLRK